MRTAPKWLPVGKINTDYRQVIHPGSRNITEGKRKMAYLGFAKLAAKVKSKKLAAWIGRKKYGKKKFQKAAAAGKKLGH